MAENYYIILGINSGASAEEIKEAYRKNVQKYHPDHYGPDSSRFILIQEAYSVLGDPDRRKRYDKSLSGTSQRHSNLRSRPASKYRNDVEPLIPISNKSKFVNMSLFNSFQNYSPSFDEIFDRFYDNFTRSDFPKSERTENLGVEITISRSEAKSGGQIELMVPVRMYCPTCRGSGDVGFWECLRCDGYGIIDEELPLLISFPAGIKNQFSKSISLNRYGITNFYLTVTFKISDKLE